MKCRRDINGSIKDIVRCQKNRLVEKWAGGIYHSIGASFSFLLWIATFLICHGRTVLVSRPEIRPTSMGTKRGGNSQLHQETIQILAWAISHGEVPLLATST